MKALQIIGIIIVVLLGLVFASTLILPGEVKVERSATINAPVKVIFPHVNNFHNWEAWSPWKEMDPNMKLEYSDVDAGEGAWYTWESDDQNVGSGKLSITKSIENKEIQTRLEFDGMDPGQGLWKFNEKEDGSTEVNWSINANLSGIGKIFGLFMDGMVGSTFEQGLSKIKQITEAEELERREEMKKMEAMPEADSTLVEELEG